MWESIKLHLKYIHVTLRNVCIMQINSNMQVRSPGKHWMWIKQVTSLRIWHFS